MQRRNAITHLPLRDVRTRRDDAPDRLVPRRDRQLDELEAPRAIDQITMANAARLHGDAHLVPRERARFVDALDPQVLLPAELRDACALHGSA
jgi:hypothetical protein